VSAVFGREPSRPLPGGDVDEARDGAPAAEPVVVEVPEGEEPAPVGEPDPAIDLRPDDVDDSLHTADTDHTDDESLDIEDLDDGEDLDDEDLGIEDLDDDDLGIEDLDDDDDLDDTDPTGEPLAFDEDEDEDEAEPELAAVPVAGTATDAPVDDGWLRRWDELQATFVDDPRAAVDGAAALVTEALSQATPGEAGTEDLRVAFRRYRAAFRDLHPIA
jgi:ribonuclease E